MIILITVTEPVNELRPNGEQRIVVSHGENTNTGESVVIPPCHPSEIGRYDPLIGEWVMKEYRP